MPPNEKKYEDLRKRAESLLGNHDPAEAKEIIQDLSSIAYELQVSHAELDIQSQDLRETQFQLQKALGEYQNLFNLAPVGILTLKPDATILRLNDTALQWFGHQVTDRPTSLTRFLPSHFTAPFLTFLAGVREEGAPRIQEFQISCVDGARRWVSVTAIGPESSWSREAFESAVVMIALTDITSLKDTQRDLQRSEEQSRAVIEAMREGLCIFDADGRLVEINPAACRLFEQPRSVLLNSNFSRLLPISERRLLVRIRHAIREHGSYDGRTMVRQFAGRQRHVRINCVMFLYRGQMHTLALLRDIEDSLQAERELQRAAVVFEHSHDGIMIAGADLKLAMVNEAACRISANIESDLLGTDILDLVADREAAPRREISQVLEENGQWAGELRLRKGDGQVFLAWVSVNKVFAQDSLDQNYIVIFHDLTAHRSAQDQILQLAHYDVLTGLPNRALFQDRLERALEHARRESTQVALLFLDLDNFKSINDSLGHQAGDELLKEIGERLQGLVRTEDTIARMGGDEFTILLGDLDGAHTAQRIVTRLCRTILESLAEPVQRLGHEMFTQSSIGIAVFPRDATHASDLVRCADTAMYAAKKDGKGTYRFFSGSMDREARRRLEVETGLRYAIGNEEFVLHFQPIVEADPGEPVGHEALLRWARPSGQLQTPDKFLAVAVETGLIIPIGKWVIREVCRTGRRLLDLGHQFGRLAVNISSRQLMDPHFGDIIQEALQETGLPPRHLEIEVCEHTLLEDMETSWQVLNHLREVGITVALDDFGTGFSSLHYLKQLPIDKIKIDRDFIRNSENDARDQAIIRAIIGLGSSLGLTIVAEGVENANQAHWLQKNGCQRLQGHHFGKPLPFAQAWPGLESGQEATS